MDQVFTHIRNIVIQELTKKNGNDSFGELFTLLKEGNYFIEVVLENFVNSPAGSSDDHIPLCFIYNSRIYETRELLQKNFNHSSLNLSKIEIAKDLQKISKKIESLDKLGEFDKFYGVLEEHYEENLQTYTGKDFDYESSIVFLFNGLTLYVLNFLDYDEGIEYGFTVEYYLNSLHTKSDIINICELEWFNKLNSGSQRMLRAGTDFLVLLLDNRKEKLLDYSPLLLEFIKAIENETAELINTYYEQIKKFSPKVVDRLSNLNRNLPNYKYLKGLQEFSRQLNYPHYKPSGIKPLYYLLYYYFLREDKKIFFDLDEILNLDKLEKLKKDQTLIKEIFKKGELRNELIHHRIIESENEFFLIYYDLVTLLRVIAELK